VENGECRPDRGKLPVPVSKGDDLLFCIASPVHHCNRRGDGFDTE
jgi:hypothetical protein